MSGDELDTHLPSKSKPKPKEARKIYAAPDGKKRTNKQEHDINEAFAITFRDPAGKLVLNYLKSITVNAVLPSSSNPNEIVYHEGARWLMAIIDTRIEHGKEKSP